jgi:eukaryotic-like serine/threonine-protein kinase
MPIVPRATKFSSGQRVSVRLTGMRIPPRVVGRYLLCDAIAAGGMATVHLGRLMGPEGFSRTVAIKQLHPQFARNPDFVAMFLDEARLASRVRHPNVVSPLDVISEPPDLFMVMDYVHGEPLSRLLRRKPEPVPARIAVAIAGQVLLGLHAAHVATGERAEPLELVHRDVSPHNILVTGDGVAKVVDFGIAKAKARSHHTEPGMLKGKLGYMAPEQLDMGTVDRRADIFAVGAVLWELLTGRRLFNGDNAQIVRDKLMHAPIERPSSVAPGLARDLDEVVMMALERSASDRFDNARAMAQALDYSLAAASMLEVSAWVESHAGAELAARAELVLDVEALSFDDFTRAARHPLSVPPRISETAPQDSVDPAALSVPATSLARSRKVWVTASLAFCLALASLGVWARSPRPAASSATGPTLVVLPAESKTTVAAAERAELILPVLPPEPPVSEPPTPPVAASAVAASARAAAKPTPSARSTAAGPCDVPYTVDKRGVKRFKEACF